MLEVPADQHVCPVHRGCCNVLGVDSTRPTNHLGPEVSIGQIRSSSGKLYVFPIRSWNASQHLTHLAGRPFKFKERKFRDDDNVLPRAKSAE